MAPQNLRIQYSNKAKKLFISLGITLVIAGIAILLTKYLVTQEQEDNSKFEGSFLGIKISFIGSVAIFAGIFFILLNSVKKLYSIIATISVFFLLSIFAFFFNNISYEPSMMMPIKKMNNDHNQPEKEVNSAAQSVECSPTDSIRIDSLNKRKK